MIFRRCAFDRANAVTHYFVEGAALTVCGLRLDNMKVKSDSAPMSCRECADTIARQQKEERSA
jgi:hypothetical protein